ncbi:hypothetical protein CSUI_003922 [Cystoisospora suis]|uniref:Uncharacterized protein n=1 Tax=Cystoisospora suis TaxID=483139 RepID=A0A2C6L3K2_9APIC|nr:hypothetical protein CSUI_003922 [Cystoisospora suis]
MTFSRAVASGSRLSDHVSHCVAAGKPKSNAGQTHDASPTTALLLIPPTLSTSSFGARRVGESVLSPECSLGSYAPRSTRFLPGCVAL